MFLVLSDFVSDSSPLKSISQPKQSSKTDRQLGCYPGLLVDIWISLQSRGRPRLDYMRSSDRNADEKCVRIRNVSRNLPGYFHQSETMQQREERRKILPDVEILYSFMRRAFCHVRGPSVPGITSCGRLFSPAKVFSAATTMHLESRPPYDL